MAIKITKTGANLVIRSENGTDRTYTAANYRLSLQPDGKFTISSFDSNPTVILTGKYYGDVINGGTSAPFTSMDALNSYLGLASYDTNKVTVTTETSVTGSTSGTAKFSQAASDPLFKRVIVYCTALVGTASYTFPTPFAHTPVVLTTGGLAGSKATALSATAMTVTGTTDTGFLIVEGY